MLLSEFVDRTGIPIAAMLDAYCALQAAKPAPWHYLNPGCGEDDLRAAEERLDFTLHPLHRIILHRSNGGDLPNIGGAIMWWAAAVCREEVWHPVGPLPPIETTPQWVLDEGPHPVPSWVMGWRWEQWDPIDAERHGARMAEFLPFAAGPDGGARIGYARGQPTIAEIRRGEQLGTLAADFAGFLRHLPFCEEDQLPDWEARIRAAIAS